MDHTSKQRLPLEAKENLSTISLHFFLTLNLMQMPGKPDINHLQRHQNGGTGNEGGWSSSSLHPFPVWWLTLSSRNRICFQLVHSFHLLILHKLHWYRNGMRQNLSCSSLASNKCTLPTEQLHHQSTHTHTAWPPSGVVRASEVWS